MSDRIEKLIQAALDTLHHDTDHGDAVDKYEREVLHRKFAAILSNTDPITWAQSAVGAKVSIDVSTGDDDAGNRVFGRVIDWQPEDYKGDKPLGVRLLCEFESVNFDMIEGMRAPVSAAVDSNG